MDHIIMAKYEFISTIIETSFHTFSQYFLMSSKDNSVIKFFQVAFPKFARNNNKLFQPNIYRGFFFFLIYHRTVSINKI